jgi:hypothetical protein
MVGIVAGIAQNNGRAGQQPCAIIETFRLNKIIIQAAVTLPSD